MENKIKPDKYQKKAIRQNRKNLLILAGAGSGKTYTIVEKIKSLLKNNIKEEEILCISFTKKSSEDLQNKLKKQEVNIKVKTFHSLGYEIITRYKEVKLTNKKTLSNIIEKELENYRNLKQITKINFITLGKEDTQIIKLQDNIIMNTNYKEKIKNTIEKFINLYKSNNMNISYYRKFEEMNNQNNIYEEKIIHKNFLKLTKKIIIKYTKILKKRKEIDYHDMINQASNILKRKQIFKYKYIIIDEYQDTSLNKIELIKEIQNQTKAKLIAVGDDYQSIYSFTGSNIDIIINFKKYFPKSKIIKLKKTYRNSKQLLKITNKFICKNPYQIRKKLKSDKSNNYPVTIYYYEKNIKEIWDKVVNNTKKEKVLILGRNNKDINKIPYIKENMKFLTIHKSKGLETDTTIIVNLENKYNSLPNKIEDDELLSYVKPKQDEYKYSEERRLFYVALTRCKNNNILLVKKGNPSEFIKEIIKNNKKKIKIIDKK